MHEYCGFCVCFQCHEKRRSHEMTDRRYDLHDLIIERATLRARVKELEQQLSVAFKAEDAKADYARELLKENARLQKLVDMNQRVVDAARKVEKVYWNFDLSMKREIEDLQRALAALDTVACVANGMGE